MKDAIANSPLTVGIKGTSDTLINYKGGVISTPLCGTNVDAYMLAVGWDTDNSVDPPQEYFIVKNSWGTGWGENGYVRIAATENEGTCGINQMVSYPLTN
jgi:C1A family cysteine protease